ncbi:uncharacterized protein BDR25DRAFT_306583 [Lindgomyces ingoldianus]|uniref:Uncharacterized protein n=1 Tax=Lindgomyces ingoldianus TaxID=673940 RepID=A0ACB6QEL1_9PLEO|nr:uncharacterized protein BDR25DRAFT_306583 [Lindgomyces ingoldianus]KAF2465424.1 hypothetical protein BDR25DRAFT_306583 [Lindgomyces ingoldianus]
MLAAFFGLIHVAVICRLINFALRIRLTKESVTLDVLRTWVDMSIPRLDWDLPLRFFFPVVFIVFLSLVPAALWAGSITPLLAASTTTASLLIPSYEDVSMIKEYPSELGKGGPSLRNSKGLFTYSVGTQHIGNILSSAASASSVGKTSKFRSHPKFDNTQFSYKGRSYGVGAPVGLTDVFISSNRQAAGYVYQEEGYLTNVTCRYNTTSDFKLSGPVNEWIYAASGNLPDSFEGEEYSNYIGHDEKAIVAMGVAFSDHSPRRYLAITAGESYGFLNNTQCEFDFTPTLFNISVDLSNFNISVSPLNTVQDFNPQRNLTRTMVRQFELISNDLTNLYVSLLGDAFNSSIAAFNMSQSTSNRNPFSESEATLGGVTNSITAMADDMLVAYASAQLMTGHLFTTQTARVYVYAIRFGQPAYIYAIFGLNLCIIVAVAAEAVRTRGWKRLGRFNYLDPRDLIVAASRGGHGVADAGDAMAQEENKKTMKRVWLLSDPDEGNGALAVRMQGDDHGHVSIVLAGENSVPIAHLEEAEEEYVRRVEKGEAQQPKKWRQRRRFMMFNFI